MFCSVCGTRNADDSNFCRHCGRKLEKQPSVRITEEEFDRALPEEEQVSALLERAYRMRKDGNTDGALALCEEALHLRPDSTTVHSLMGQIYESRGEIERAIQAFERVVQLNPGSIADRVKLDDLRGGAPHRDRSPRILRTSGHGPEQWSGVSAVITVVGLLLIVVLLRLLFWPPAPVFRGPAQATANLGGASAAARQATNAPPLPGGADLMPHQIAPAQTSGLVLPDSTPIIVRQPQPTVVYERAPAAAGATEPAAKPVRGTVAPRNDRTPVAGRRVVLPDDDGVSDLGNGTYRIRVGKPEDDQTGTAVVRMSAPDRNNSNQIRVGSKSSADAGVAPTEEAKGLMAVATDLKVKGQYKEALNAFRRALPGAGDDAGVVSENIAWVYQQMNDKASARDHYQGAIAEFKKLESAGRMTDVRRDALRICERGLKICSE